jgi:hypothetical protein
MHRNFVSLMSLCLLMTALGLLSGCASTISPTLVNTPGLSVEVQGCKPDVVTVWNGNATIKADGHAITVDETFVTVDGQYINRPKFKQMVITCKGGRMTVTLDGKPFKQLAGR